MTAFLVVANARAGTSEQEIVAEACDALGCDGAAVEDVATNSPDDIDAVLDRLDGRRLVVAGGDGSVHAAVNRLWQRGQAGEVEVALIPLGTGNDLARGVGLPLDAGAAAELARTGTAGPVDLLVDEAGAVVVNAAHAGLGAEAADVSADLKDRLGGLAYPVGALVAAVRESGWRLTVEVDGRAAGGSDEPVLMVGVGNGRTIGGGTPLFPQAEVDDGVADVVVSTATGPAARVAFGVALRTGAHVDRDDVTVVRGREVRITGEPVRHNADGEVTDELSSRIYRLEPSAWRLVR